MEENNHASHRSFSPPPRMRLSHINLSVDTTSVCRGMYVICNVNMYSGAALILNILYT